MNDLLQYCEPVCIDGKHEDIAVLITAKEAIEIQRKRHPYPDDIKIEEILLDFIAIHWASWV